MRPSGGPYFCAAGVLVKGDIWTLGEARAQWDESVRMFSRGLAGGPVRMPTLATDSGSLGQSLALPVPASGLPAPSCGRISVPHSSPGLCAGPVTSPFEAPTADGLSAQTVFSTLGGGTGSIAGDLEVEKGYGCF